MILLDTNILTRSIELNHPHQRPALDAMKVLSERGGEILVVNPQAIIEFYAVATRAANNIALTPDQALEEIARIKRKFPVIPETPEVFAKCEQLIAKYKPTNRRVYDTRHVAFMLVHNIPKILTFNDKDFASYSEVEVLNPFEVLGVPRK